MLYKYQHVSCSFIFILALTYLIPVFTHSCIHHKVSIEDVPVSKPQHIVSKAKRQLFAPLDIHVHMDEIDAHIGVLQRINVALKKVIRFFHDTFEVRQSPYPFLLERLNCIRKWQSGPNKNKCSRLKSGPEFCSIKLTHYPIPDAYLNKLEIYNYSHSTPNPVLQEVSGLYNASFILFVIAKTSSWCGQSDVQAYGSYCRLDSQNRPIAGLLNLCPSKFSNKIFRDSHYYNVIMHELIHILGFSHHLYSKFKTCDSVNGCENPKKMSFSDTHGFQRLVFPEVIKSMQAHFNCSEPEFGAPLEAHEKEQLTSHWHPTLMYTSIMTPSLFEDSYVVVDNITLALLYSSGWYKVNFKNAQNFLYGKGAGCRFGFNDHCETFKQNNNSNAINSGCDKVEFSIGKCESVVPFHDSDIKDETKCFNFQVDSAFDIRMINYQEHCTSIHNENNMTDPLCIVKKCKRVEYGRHLGNITNSYLRQKVTRNSSCSNSSMHFCALKSCSCTYNSKKIISVQMSFNKASPSEKCNLKTKIPLENQESSCNESIYGDKTNFMDFHVSLNGSSEDYNRLSSEIQMFLKCSYLKISENQSEDIRIKLEPQTPVSSNSHDQLDVMPTISAVFCVLVLTSLVYL